MPHALWSRRHSSSCAPTSTPCPPLQTNCFLAILKTTPEDLLPTVYLCVNRVAPAHHGIELGVGESTLIKASGRGGGGGGGGKGGRGRMPACLRSAVGHAWCGDWFTRQRGVGMCSAHQCGMLLASLGVPRVPVAAEEFRGEPVGLDEGRHSACCPTGQQPVL